MKGHKDEVNSVAFSPNGKYLATASWDHLIKLWNLATFEEIETLRGHTSYARTVEFMPDGVTVISGSEDTTLRIWNV